MKRIQTTLVICAALLGSGLQWAQATSNEGEPGWAEIDEKGAGEHGNAEVGNSVKAVVENGTGTVTYNGKKVWRGEVKDHLGVAAGTATDRDAKHAAGTELAAAWDGEKLVWENVEGAGQALDSERRQMLKRLEGAKKRLR